MNKQDLINELNNSDLSRFITKINNQFDLFLKKNKNDSVAKLSKELKIIITELNDLIDKVDYRQMSFFEYENLLPNFKIRVSDIINQLPQEYFV